MTFPAYPQYKDSGAEWLGEIPQHWKIFLAKRLFRNARDTAQSGSEQLAATQAYGVIPQKDFMEKNDVKVVLALAGTQNFKGVLANDFVISLRSFQGGIEHSAYDGCVSPAYTVLRRNTENDVYPGLFKYLLKEDAYISALQSVTTGIREGKTITYDQFGSLLLPVAASSEQTQIARFLDHETARIDALIKEQQRLIELLKEKRQAVISHAVTKGLDPTVPMKDSGVEWLGDVPAHWVVCATRRAIRFIEQGWSPECESYPAEEDGWGVLKAGCVNRGFFDASENKTLPSTLTPIPEYEVRAGDILMSRASGSPELVGSTALLGQVRERLMLSDKIFRIHLEEKVSSQFFVWVMNAQFMRSQIEQALSGGNGLANNLPQSSLLAFWLAMPPEHEQGAIAELINEQTGRIDELIVEGDVAVELLQERRSALISAAVTGKIDVRGWQPPASAPTPELVQEAV